MSRSTPTGHRSPSIFTTIRLLEQLTSSVTSTKHNSIYFKLLLHCMLQLLIAISIILIILSFVVCAFYCPAALLVWFPTAIIIYTIITTCLVIVPAEKFPEPGHWSGHEYPSYGYTSDNQILPPGYEGFKFPWTTVTIMQNRPHNVNIEIPCQTTDGMRLLYRFTIYHSQWDPTLYNTLYNHDESYFKQQMINNLKPTVDRIMSTKTEADIELHGGATSNQLEKALRSIIKHPGLYHAPKSNYDYGGYFIHLDSPQFNYACQGIGGGYCTSDNPAPNRYVPGQPIPHREDTTTQSAIDAFHDDPTELDSQTPYIDGGFETQEELNAFLDETLIKIGE